MRYNTIKGVASIISIAVVLMLILPTLMNTPLPVGKYNSNYDGGWISLDGSGEIIPPKFKVISADKTEIVFELEFHGFFSENIEMGREIYQKVSIQYGGYTGEIGMPLLPTFRRYFATPLQANMHLSVTEMEYVTLEKFNILPTPEPSKNVNRESFDVIPTNTANSLDGFYPRAVASCGSPKNLRGVHISQLILYPLTYDSETKELRGYTKIKGKIGFSDSNGIYYIPKLRNRYFEPLYKNLLINYAILEMEYEGISSNLNMQNTDYDLLIIAEDSLYDAILPLAQWRNKMGIKTNVTKTSEIPSAGPLSSNDVYDYIEQEYTNHEISYLLLVGDTNLVPTSYDTPIHPANGEYGGYYTFGSDYPYLCHPGPGLYQMPLWPDIFGGRLSVDSQDQLAYVVDKILTYEKNPPSGNWFNNVLVICEDDSSDLLGTFHYFSELVADFLVQEGYNVERIYEGDQNYDGDTQDIIDAIDDGAFLVTYRDHAGSGNHPPGGWSTGWSHPSFITSDVTSLDNGYMSPLFFDICCESGWYDGETDLWTGWNEESLPESLLRKEANGSIGSIAATRISYSLFYNDFFFEGLVDSIWPDYLSGYPTGGDTNPWASNPDPLYQLGKIIIFAKYYVWDHAAHNDYTDTTIYQFNLHGDPCMEIWTSAPETMDVTYTNTPNHYWDGNLYYFKDQMDVEVLTAYSSPVEDALVCVMNYSSDLYIAQNTDQNGESVFSIPPTPDGYIDITTTKHNYLPHEDTVVIDQTPPITSIYFFKPSYKKGIGALWITSDTNISLSAIDGGSPPSGIYRTYYSFDGEIWYDTEDSSIFNVPGEGFRHIYYYSQDNVYNYEAIKDQIVILDNSPPITTLEIASSPNPHSQIVYINSSDKPEQINQWDAGAVGIDKIYYKVWNSSNGWTGWKNSSTNVSFPIENNNVHIIQYFAVDLLGNAETTSWNLSKTVHPYSTSSVICMLSPMLPDGTGGWYANAVTINLISIDEKTDSLHYKIGSNNWAEYINPIIMTENGEQIISFYSVNKDGREGEIISTTVKVDKTNPSVYIEEPSANYLYVFDRKIAPLKHTIILGKAPITANASDETSQIEKVEFYIDGELKHTAYEEPYEWHWDENAFGRHSIRVVAYDSAGNTASDEAYILIFNM